MPNLEGELRLNAVMRSMLQKMIQTIADEQFYSQLAGGGNSPGWILGHLVVVNRFGHAMLGGPAVAQHELATFGPGSSPELNASQCPTKEELLAAEQETASALIAAVEQAEPSVLEAPRQSPLLQKEFPTVGNMLAHILASHLSLHIGQLSAWRRSRGLPSILQV